MTLDEMRQEISRRTGVPAEILTGETAEEQIAQAKAMLAYKKESGGAVKKTEAEQFREWFNTVTGNGSASSEDPFIGLEQELKQPYPTIQDASASDPLPKAEDSVAESFANWLQNIF